jgi:hypothetical protein
MLPKNKLRNARLSRLKIFEEEHAGAFMKNVVRRYDNIVIPSTKQVSAKTLKKVEANEVESLVKDAPRTKDAPRMNRALRQDDTPPLGSLGGQLPKSLVVPKIKAPKVNRKKPAPGQMKIFDSQGRQWGRRKWKEEEEKAKPIVDVKTR